MSIAENLRQLRRNAGMTQEQAADKIGVTRQALSSYESGRTRPDIDMLLRLGELYGTDLEGVVYGQDRALREIRTVKRIARVLYVLIAALTVARSALLWSANRFFAITGGTVSEEKRALFETRARLVHAWEAVDGLTLTLTFAGFFLLVILLAAWKCRISMRSKLLYAAALGLTVFAGALPFAVTDPVFAPINYFVVPLWETTEMAGFLAVHAGVDALQRKRHERA